MSPIEPPHLGSNLSDGVHDDWRNNRAQSFRDSMLDSRDFNPHDLLARGELRTLTRILQTLQVQYAKLPLPNRHLQRGLLGAKLCHFQRGCAGRTEYCFVP